LEAENSGGDTFTETCCITFFVFFFKIGTAWLLGAKEGQETKRSWGTGEVVGGEKTRKAVQRLIL